MSTVISDNEEERIQWLHQSRLLDTPHEDAYDDLTRLAAQICRVPVAGISLIDEQRQWFKSIIGSTASQMPRAVALCAYTILQPEVLIVPDTTQDDRFKNNPFVTGEPYLRFYAGAPLITSEGFALGTLFISDNVPRELTAEQTAVLATLARQVVDRIEMQRRIALQEEMAANQARLMADLLRTGSALQETDQRLRQSEMHLQQSEERLRLALVSGGLGTFDLDLTTGKYLEISALWREQYGVSQDKAEFSSEEWLQIIHPEDRARTHEAVQQAVEEHRDYHAEYRLVLPNGEVHWSSSHGTPLYSSTGEPLRFVGVTRNITERKMREAGQEQALHEAQEQADRDPLTGLWNHRAFYRRLEEECARTERGGLYLAVVMLDLDQFGFFNNVYGHVIGDAVLRQVAERLLKVSRSYDTCARFGGDEFGLILSSIGQASASEIEHRLRLAMSGLTFQPAGAETAVPITLSLGATVFLGTRQDCFEAVKSADERLRQAKTGEVSNTEADQVRLSALAQVADFSMLTSLVTAVDNKDRYTLRHSQDVMAYSLMIGRKLGLGEDELQTVAVAALLHDLGKIGVADTILRKPGKLTAEEFEAIKRHPQTGAVIVAAVPGLEGTLDAVRHHHEQWDGGGYPSGLQGEQTPLMARLMAVADAFSAMTTDRPYRQGMDKQEAFSILEAGAGMQWDPVCVSAFLVVMREAQAHGDTNSMLTR